MVGVHVGVDDVGDGHAVLGREVQVGLRLPGGVDDDATLAGDTYDVRQARLGGTLELPDPDRDGQTGDLERHEQAVPGIGAALE